MTDAERLAYGICGMCHSCAEAVHNGRPPSGRYARWAGQLLFGTAAHESVGFKYRRQIGFSLENSRGGWGLWQLESGSMGDSIKYIDGRPALRENVTQWLGDYDEDGQLGLVPAILGGAGGTDVISRLIAEPIGDPLACLLARLHYMRFPEAIPGAVTEQAKYWKHRYNTHLGKGTPNQYAANWERHCARIDGEWMLLESALEIQGEDIPAVAAVLGISEAELEEKLDAFLGTDKETGHVADSG